MPHLPKKLKRELSANEQMHRYFKRLEAELRDKSRIAGVTRLGDDGVEVIMQILRVDTSYDGFHIQVR